MIAFEGVTKTFRLPRGGAKPVLSDVSFAIPSGTKIGVLGGNGAGKSTLLKLVSGIISPDSGRIHRTSKVSFPLGFTGNFHPNLTGRQNARFVARVYGADLNEVERYVEEFSELDRYFDAPIIQYSAGMHAKLSFGVSLALDFDIYLIDEVTEVGDARFREKCAYVFREKTKNKGLFMVSHNSATIRRYCDYAAILDRGKMSFFDSIDTAFDNYRSLMGTESA